MTAGTWTEETVGGHICDVYEPAEPHPQGFTLLYLHGVHLNRLNDKASFIEQFDAHQLPVVAPRTQRSWWTDRVCEEFDSQLSAEQYVLQVVLPFIAERWSCEPPQIGLFGTSMGGQGALKFAYKYPRQFPVVAAISPAVDYHTRFMEGDETLPLMYESPEAARQDTALLHVHPLNWPRHQFFCCDPTDFRWLDSADRLRMKLGSLGVPFECDLETVGGGHGFSYYNVMAKRTVEFLVERLEQERLRVP